MNGFDFTTLTANSANYANLCIVAICLIRLIRRLEQIILFCVANALSAFFQPKQNIFLNCRTAA